MSCGAKYCMAYHACCCAGHAEHWGAQAHLDAALAHQAAVALHLAHLPDDETEFDERHLQMVCELRKFLLLLLLRACCGLR